MFQSLKYSPLFRTVFKYPLQWRAHWLNGRLNALRHQFEDMVVGGDIILRPINLKRRFKIPATSELAIRTMLTGVFEPQLAPVIKAAWGGKGDIINIGANVGLWSVGLVDLCPGVGKVYAIEPNPEAFRCLTSNIELNELSQKVIPINACVAEEEGEVVFEVIIGKPEYSSIGKIVHSAVLEQPREQIKVKARPLDKFPEIRSEEVRLVLIDIEGAEYLAIKAAREWFAKYRPTIIFECSQSLLQKFGHSVPMLRSLLVEIGYEVRMAEAKHLPVPDHFEGDAIAYWKG